MKVGEKGCPRCAGAVPKAAHLCKHCGQKFSEAEIAEGQRQDSQAFLKKGGWAVGGGALLVLSLSMCSTNETSQRSNEDGAATTADAAPTEANAYADVGKQALWLVRSKDAIRLRLKDPDSAQFRDVHFYSGGSAPVACGEVNGKNAFGGYSGFERFVASGSKMAVLASEMKSASEMDKVWKEMCVKSATDEA